MRISTNRWILGWAALLSLTVSAAGCKTGGGFAAPSSSWLGMGKKPATTSANSSATQPPSISFSPNSSTTPPAGSTASAQQAKGSLGAGSASAGFTAPQKTGGFYTGNYNTNPSQSLNQAGLPQGRSSLQGGTGYSPGSQPASGGAQKGFYSQDPGPTQNSRPSQVSSQFPSQYRGTQPAYGQNSNSFGQSPQVQTNPYAEAGSGSRFSNNAMADARNSSDGNLGYSGSSSPGNNWGSGASRQAATWGGANSSNSGATPSYETPRQTQPAGGFGTSSQYSDPYQGTQSKPGFDSRMSAGSALPSSRPAEASSSQPMYPRGLAVDSNYRPGSTSRNASPSTAPLYGAGDIQQAGYDNRPGATGSPVASNPSYSAFPGAGSGPGTGSGYNAASGANSSTGGGWQQPATATTPQYPATGGTWSR